MPEPVTIGRFRVVARLSSPASDVFHAIDPRGEHPRAVHVVCIPDQAWAETLRRELTELIERPVAGVLRIYEFELQETTAYIVTEPLADRLSFGVPGQALPRSTALTLVANYCRAASALRARAITCLSALPNNIWRTLDAEIRIGEFVPPALESRRVTHTGAAINPEELPFLAPELVKGVVSSPNQPTDVFAAGALLYQLVAHRRPFVGDTTVDYLAAVANGKREQAPTFDEPSGRDLIGLIERMLADDPGQRPHLDGLADDLDRLARDGAAAPTSSPTPGAQPATTAPNRETVFDEHVQFTVYRPKRVAPLEWEPLLVFAHLSERRDDSPEDPDPLEEVQRQAEAILGAASHTPQSVDSSQAVPRQGEITFIPQVPGVEFDPPARRFRWVNPVHREEFLLRVGDVREGAVVRGRVTVYLGAIILAEIPLTLTIGRSGTARSTDLSAQSARPYRRIFASYSHRDRAVVEEFAAYAKAVGDRYQMDVIDLRSGERWEPALETMIRDADVFQLFWSWNALDSAFVQHEWQYALQLARPAFVRPVYWDDPLPRRGSLPPSALLDLHFESIRPRHFTSTPPTTQPLDVSVDKPRAPAATPVSDRIPSAPLATTPAPATPAPKRRGSSWRIYATAAVALLALVTLPALYVGMRTASRPPVSSLPQPGTGAPSTVASSLTVTVRSDDGRPQANTEVELVEPGSGRVVSTARTNDIGKVVFNGVKVDAYDVRAKSAKPTASRRVTVTNRPAVVDVVIPPAITPAP
jgi:hypothetical protein